MNRQFRQMRLAALVDVNDRICAFVETSYKNGDLVEDEIGQVLRVTRSPKFLSNVKFLQTIPKIDKHQIIKL